ncbi:2-keto-4-pentenoate hydratase [Mycolicibacterium aromaticivorans JS19b1 = JCM 16368]|uniref:2-keto-4-pentenoate hydratase n=1 Tax=Mycolicibacterium aromaticivorans JS19b1 = JCM 16368 TaxID=1440774 RepID=A0A064CEW8_9MYCO|nr:fumarylacetoacetate hydrolase family protein [Mycolicibacterium aromaticivorans]KDE98236.1 2-keto-4-pentenoate hydratase [Mycolicibacterium aromaticivorans JS19b1 = JCM 16368]
MMLSRSEIEDAAGILAVAAEQARPTDQLTGRYPGMDVGDAYAIQKVNLARHLGAGRCVVGHKIGLTSEPMQTLLGVDEPDFGYILDDMVLANDSTAQWARFCAPRVEPEVAFLLRAPLRGPNVTVHDVRAATSAVAVALEIVDSRIRDWKLTLRDTVADNASSGAVVVGEWVPYSEHLDLAASRASLRLNGHEVDTGLGSAVLGDPATAVAWLANSLSEFGTELAAGQFVMSGSFTTAAFVRSGDIASAAISGLGVVSVRFA